MLPNVSYNRSERCYQVVNPDTGEIAEFPAGRDGRQAAFKLAVATENNRLYRMALAKVDAAPLLESRVWRACELVLTNGVTLLGASEMPPAVATVASSNEYGDYIVSQMIGQWVCECEDWRGGMCPADDTGPRCKHTLAAEWAAELLKLRCYFCNHPNDFDAELCAECGELVTPF